MGNIELNIDVDGASRVDDALRDGLEDGLVDAGDWLVREGREKARDRIRQADRVWRERVYHAWDTSGADLSGDARYTRTLRNVADHAGIVEHGLKPGTAPPVQRIIPWISDTLTPNAETVAEAQKRDVTEWDPALQALAQQYSEAYVLTAFKVKNHLENNGYRGIGFMDAAERYMSQYGPMVLHRKVEKHMERQLRQHGLK